MNGKQTIDASQTKAFVKAASEVKFLSSEIVLKLKLIVNNKRDMGKYPNDTMIELKTYLNGKLEKEVEDLRKALLLQLHQLHNSFSVTDDFDEWFS